MIQSIERAKNHIQVSFLVPARNASPCLRQTLEAIHSYLSQHFLHSFEIILIPNGSTENELKNTAALIPELMQLYPEIKICSIPVGQRGKGLALQAGIQISQGEWIFFTDADLPYQLNFFDQARAYLESGYDFVIGNRRLPQSYFSLPGSVLRLAYGRHRLGLMFNRVVRLLFGIHSRDTQAGIKAMSRRFAEKASSRQTCPGFLFDIEFFLVANQNGFLKAELPVHLHLKNEKSTVRLLGDGWRALYWLGRIFIQNCKGHYGSQYQILERFWAAPFFTKVFLYLRWNLTPYSVMASHLPRQGKILDLGCGHGLFSMVLAAIRPSCQIEGIDHDEARIRLAKSAGEVFTHLKFNVGDLRKQDEKSSFSGISIIDTLHYFYPKHQEETIRRAYAMLSEGGVLLIREVDQSGGLRSAWNKLYEKLATSLRFTQTAEKICHFRKPSDWASLLRGAGFSVSWLRCSSILFSDVLFVATKESKPYSAIPQALPLIHVTADDWGLTPAVNRGILSLARQGLVNRVSILVDAPFVEYGLSELRSLSHVQVGLHFNLTYQSHYASPFHLLLASINPFQDRELWKTSIRVEFQKQLFKMRDLGLTPKHVDGHHHAHIFPGIVEEVAQITRKCGIHEVRLPSDPALWKSSKMPLLLLCRLAKPILERQGFDSKPCFYPPLSLFKNPEKLWDVLKDKANHEVIIHPADEDDLRNYHCKDPYTHQRVIEFQAIQLGSAVFPKGPEFHLNSPLSRVEASSFQ